MKTILLSLLALGLGISSANADLKEYLHQKKNRVQVDNEIEPQIFDQKVDHFSENADTFKQRYWVDGTYAKNTDSPVLYVICGEATCGGASDMEPINNEAKRLGAYLVALEHRYYGYSIPTIDLSNDNLKFLSQEQAIEDLAEFQKFAIEKLQLHGKWVAIGGSYSGSLSAFYRMKHPDLVVGSLASSAPVLAKADFFEYDRHIAKVAGDACLTQIQKTVAEVERRLESSSEREQVRTLFDANEVKDDRDFLYAIADMSAIAIQYGAKKRFCDPLIAAGNDIDAILAAYAKIGIQLFTEFGITVVQDTFQGAESVDPMAYVDSFGMRSWMYQSCTQFGYYQIANPDTPNSARSVKITQAYHDEVCERLFGLQTPVNTEKTNQDWFNQLFLSGVSNIFFTNGSDDPWSNLSILVGSPESKKNPSLEYFTIEGEAHCSDLTRRKSESVKSAQAQFSALNDVWLK